MEVSGGAAGHLQRFPFVEDLSESEEKEGKEEGTTTKAVVVHGVPTNWRINGVADCAERIMAEVIGVRWLLKEKRRECKAASSVVVYLPNEVFLGPEVCMKMSGNSSILFLVWGGVVVPEVWSGLREGFRCYTGGTHEGVVVILEVGEVFCCYTGGCFTGGLLEVLCCVIPEVQGCAPEF